MKFVLSFIVLVAMTAPCFAQFNQDKMFYAAKAERYRRMKNTGTLLTVAGGILTVVGVSTLSKSSTTYYSNGTTSTTGNPEVGALEFLLGTAGLGAGIPLWIVGAHAERKYIRKLENMTVGFNIHRERTAFSLSYRF